MTWQDIQELLQSLKWAFAGLIGAMIVSRFHKDELTSKTDYFVFVASGAAIAHFLTGAVAAWFGFDASSAGAIGFLLGAFGGSLMQAVVRSIKAADLWGLVKARFGGPKQ
ncbi:holin class III [Achromobacter phage Mano]|uniref:Holin class III n=1 Tax=Achromobacter phage Mano TaxID=2767570 RepID=A0A7L8G6D0_9CAUD|nr:holin [Achromobacter phage Mano]QOE32793.1 holin class III [Achromobacter phage Mano]